MSQIWTFSPSSEPLMQRCIEAALLQDTDNKWIQKFGRKTIRPLTNSEVIEEKPTADVIEVPLSPKEQQKTEVSVSYDDFFSSIENEIRISYIVEECTNNPNLLVIMAQRLPTSTVEKLYDTIFASNNIEHTFMVELFHKFLPLYIKQQYSCLCIDILTKTNEKYLKIFQKLLRILLEDIEIPNLVLYNFVSILDEHKVTSFMENITTLELSSESFTHNVLTICTAYKGCKKTEKIQNWLQANLLRHCKKCALDRNYGRLFLAFLQTAKLQKHCVSRQLVECLEEHQSPFKRPCAMLVKELIST